MPEFTIEKVVDYLINRKEKDCMRVEDWKSFKAGGYKLYKEGHIQDYDHPVRFCFWYNTRNEER